MIKGVTRAQRRIFVKRPLTIIRFMSNDMRDTINDI